MYGNGIFFLQIQDQTRLAHSQWLPRPSILNATVNVRTNLQGSTLTVARLPGASEMRLRLRARENGTQLARKGERASENYSVICSIPEEQND